MDLLARTYFWKFLFLLFSVRRQGKPNGKHGNEQIIIKIHIKIYVKVAFMSRCLFCHPISNLSQANFLTTNLPVIRPDIINTKLKNKT